jgi:Rrf2 family protein
MASSRFAVAVHVLALHATCGDRPLTSGFVARSVNTNPVVVRRLMGRLRRAGLVSVKPGPGGGSRLARQPARVRLAEVYRAVEDEGLLAMHRHGPNPRCPVGARIQEALAGIFDAAEAGFVKALEGRTLADVLARIASAPAPGRG